MSDEKSCKICDGVPCGNFGKTLVLLRIARFEYPDGTVKDYCTEWQNDGIDRHPEELAG